MPLSETEIAALAADYLAAEAAAQPIAPIRDAHPDLAEGEAYAIQAALLDLKRAGGATPSGHKIGATNAGAQAAFGLREPVRAELFAEAQVAAGAAVAAAALIHPRIECEIAFRMAADLAGPGVTPEQALAAVGGVMAAFEIVDARTAGWAAKMPEMIADNVFQARYVLSTRELPAAGLDLAAIRVRLLKNGVEAAAASGANVLGSPAIALAWLANHLAAAGRRLRAGEIVLAGSLTPLVPVAAGETCTAIFDELGPVEVSFR